ncbi:SpoIIE family protein phosphatase [Nocardioides pacificus]
MVEEPLPSSRGDATELIVHLTETINSNLDLRLVLQAVTDTGTRLSGASFGAFFYNATDDRGNAYRLHVLSGADAAQFEQMPSPRITALFEPTFSGRGLTRVDDLSLDPRVTGLPRGHLPLRSYLGVPVVSGHGAVIGALLFGHPEPHRFDGTTERLVQAVAAHAAVAVENARLYAREKSARMEAERTAQELTMLQGATARLASALTAEDALDAMAETLLTQLDAMRIAVFLREGDEFRSMGTRATPERTGHYYQSAPTTFPSLVRDATLTHAPVWVTCRPEFEDRYPELAEALPDVGSVIALPLTVTASTRGALVLQWFDPRGFSDSHVRFFEAVAGQLASTLERVRLHEAEAAAQRRLHRHVAELTESSTTLQRSLLPQRLPDVPGIDVAVRYLPGTAGAEVGGDWYDVVVGSGGQVTLVVGDVEGHSFSAAAVMGRVSTALHAYLAEGHPPDVALARVNPLVEEAGVIVTCCLATLDPATGQVALVRAGHPLPVLRRADGTVLEVGHQSGPPLGVPGASWPVTLGQVQAGDRAVLYTDGLVEHRTGDMDSEVSRLLDAVRDGHGTVEEAADLVLDRVMLSPEDDIALLIADFAHLPGHAAARLTVHSEVEVAAARAFTRDTVRQWCEEGTEETATLLVSEMVTNALIHAVGPAVLELTPVDGGVRIAVTDREPQHPQPRSASPDALGGRGLLLVEALAEQWGIEGAGVGKTVWATLAP